MGTPEWVAALIGTAGVVAAIGAIVDEQFRGRLVAAAVVLCGAALLLGFRATIFGSSATDSPSTPTTEARKTASGDPSASTDVSKSSSSGAAPVQPASSPAYLIDLQPEHDSWDNLGLGIIDGKKYYHSYIETTCLGTSLSVPLDAAYSRLTGTVGYAEDSVAQEDSKDASVEVTSGNPTSTDASWSKIESYSFTGKRPARVEVEIPAGTTGIRLDSSYGCSQQTVWGDMQVVP
jgi:hypothetical protein